ncbi:ninjurin-1 isoform X2 [Hyalella azteca]|uniref:Ninjurin-1 isoform X2 n=1 Tax=Hyalella azteca TaxID=294128 RepID=A0A8B7NDA0_HYAAZ|nr:ninjurin-1 isoform X2 [Hyalella azteca]
MNQSPFAPVYTVPGVSYSAPASSGNRARVFEHSLDASTFAKMSIEPADDLGRKTLNPNTYATRKTIAQGMLDIALLTANASQLRYVLNLGDKHDNYQLMVGLIVTSLVLQVLVGILFLIIGALNINKLDQQFAANILNNIIGVMLFTITVVNVVLNAFGLSQPPVQ